MAALLVVLALAGCTNFAVVKWGVDLCAAVAPANATPAEVEAIAKKCGEGK